MLVAKERDGQIVETFGWDGIGLIAKDGVVYANEAHVSGGVPLAAIDAGSESAELQYFDSDYLGTTTAVYSATGEVDAKLAGSFGAGTESDEVRFTGKPYDADLDAHVFPYRNYKSEAGRWASADPAGFPDGPNQHYYACVPTMGLDPLGLITYEIVTGSGTYNEYDFYVENDEYSYSFTYSDSTGSTLSGSVTSELSMTNTGIAVSAGIAVSQLHTSSVTVTNSWVVDGAASNMDQSVGGTTASQFVPTIPTGWAFDSWITSPVNNQTDLRDSGWENDTFPSGAVWRSKGIYTDYDYAYSYQIFEQ
jgi:RHS repeat-associated protein